MFPAICSCLLLYSCIGQCTAIFLCRFPDHCVSVSSLFTHFFNNFLLRLSFYFANMPRYAPLHCSSCNLVSKLINSTVHLHTTVCSCKLVANSNCTAAEQLQTATVQLQTSCKQQLYSCRLAANNNCVAEEYLQLATVQLQTT